MNKPIVSLMVAMANNRCIGVENRLPWHLPADLRHFKNTTSGKPVVMGRKTYESIGRPLPNRTNIVVSRNVAWQASGVVVVNSLPLALERAAELGAGEVVIIGGAQIYQAALAFVDRMYITRVDADIEGDAFFPAFEAERWQRTSYESFTVDDSNNLDYSFECWDLKSH